jgi:hypothetical protein
MRVALLCAVALAGCTARRLAAPPEPSFQAERSDLRRINLHVVSFDVEGRGSEDRRRQVASLEQRFLDYLEARSHLTTIYVDRNAEMHAPALALAVRVSVDHTTYRTWILDAVGLFPYILGMFTPSWGHADVGVQVDVTGIDGTPLATYEHAARVDFSNYVYSWFRTRFVEDAYRAAYAETFDSIAAALAADAGRLRTAALAQPGAGQEVAALPEPPAPAAPSSEYDYVVPVEALEPERPRRFGLITESTTPPFDGTVYGALRLLGGLEIAGMYGLATVSSSTHTGAGAEQTIASGDADQVGWRVALYGAPDSTGFFVYPTIGYMQQRIDIADFRADLSSEQPEVDGATEIAATCSNPDTGVRLDCNAPNTYRLDLTSLYLGARAGYDLVAGSASFVLFASLSGGINLVEYRTLRAQIAQYSGEQSAWAGASSFALGLTLGFALPKLHWALRFIGDYELYRTFEYAQPLEFEGPVVWDAERDRYIRQHVFVDDAKLNTWSFQLATAVVF